MKENATTHGKMTLVASLLGVFIVLILASPSQSVAAGKERKEDVKRSIYFKVFQGADLIPNQDKEVIVSCDSYDDHIFYRSSYPDGPPTTQVMNQTDMIIGVSGLCTYSYHIDPIIHVDGNQGDFGEYIDGEDGFTDFYSATVVCKDEFGNFWPPSRVVLECLDHDAIR